MAKSFRWTNSKFFLGLIFSLVLVFLLAACGQETDSGEGAFTPGTYEGSESGMNGEVVVDVTLDESSITEVVVKDHNESPGIADPAIDQIPERIVAQQSLEVDTVSGATITSDAIIGAVANALEDNDMDVESLAAVEAEETDGETIEKTADVVIIGGGGAGLAAGVSALENNASVLILEKMPNVGGSTVMAGGQYNAVDQERQQNFEMRPELIAEIETYIEEPQNETHERLMEELQAQIDEYKENGSTHVFDSPQLHALQTYRGGDQLGDLDLIEEFAYGAEESVPWLEDLDVEFRDEVAIVTGALWQRTHQFTKPLVTGPIDAYMEKLEASDDAELLLETTGEELIVEDNKVVGVKATRGNDEYIIRANNGVIIATGGFARNEELILEHDKHWGDLEGLNSTNAVSATGDGIIMSEAVDANLVGMEWIQLLPVGDPETGGMQGNISINAANQLFINEEGNRFVAEDERRDVLTEGLMEQPNRKMFILHDAQEYTDESVKNDFNETIGELVESGKVVTGDTIEELAENMGVDVDNLLATVEEYNQVVAGKMEDPFGKKLLENPFNQPPYYASERVPTVHHTMGGLEINELAQVMNSEGKVIQGLYAAGEVTGGLHGANRLGGNAVPDTVVFGRIAGESAALKK